MRRGSCCDRQAKLGRKIIPCMDIHTRSVYKKIMNEARQAKTRKRINVILPYETLEMIDEASKRGDRSRLIDRAVRFYIVETGRDNVKKQLREGALRRSERDLRMAEEWFRFENEAWQKSAFK